MYEVNSIDTAVCQSLTQTPNSNSFIPHHDLQSAGLVPPNMTLADRAFLEACVLMLVRWAKTIIVSQPYYQPNRGETFDCGVFMACFHGTLP